MNRVGEYTWNKLLWRLKMKKVTRKKSYQLRYIKALGARTQLPYSQQQYVLNLKKGYEGEKRFDDLIAEHFMDGVTVLTDLLVSVNGSTAQIDALIVLEDIFYLYEVKNYEGEYQKLPGQFRKLSGQEFICPSLQLLRTKKVLQQILSQWNEMYEIRPYVLFVNPGFTLFDAKISDPFILPTQISKHLGQLSKKKIALSKNCSPDKKAINTIERLHRTISTKI